MTCLVQDHADSQIPGDLVVVGKRGQPDVAGCPVVGDTRSSDRERHVGLCDHPG